MNGVLGSQTAGLGSIVHGDPEPLAALRDALLPKLISGELRVPFQKEVTA